MAQVAGTSNARETAHMGRIHRLSFLARHPLPLARIIHRYT
jgi:hypothetical protein